MFICASCFSNSFFVIYLYFFVFYLFLFFFFFFMFLIFFFFFFFFSSRRRHTRLTCDWSSDVCSSDLLVCGLFFAAFDVFNAPTAAKNKPQTSVMAVVNTITIGATRSSSSRGMPRSEERRVGKECRGRGASGDGKRKKRRKERMDGRGE